MFLKFLHRMSPPHASLGIALKETNGGEPLVKRMKTTSILFPDRSGILPIDQPLDALQPPVESSPLEAKCIGFRCKVLIRFAPEHGGFRQMGLIRIGRSTNERKSYGSDPPVFFRHHDGLPDLRVTELTLKVHNPNDSLKLRSIEANANLDVFFLPSDRAGKPNPQRCLSI
ncbi:MAG: hypothetical protein BWY82_01643 [Verrucomicrobia bacterium ADurb.Bin474]|nr:MAG: hypothetical protein BWY82_01643 [Verrucomicrobia bacterium ADurb.Bin474]